MSPAREGLVSIEISQGNRYIGSVNAPAVPNAGEILRYDGKDYAVISRRWATDRDNPVLYCYLQVEAP